MRTLFERRHSVLVRRSVAAALLGGVALSGALAMAEEPVAVSDELTPPTTVTQQTTTTTVVATPPVTMAPALPPPPLAPPPMMAPPMMAPPLAPPPMMGPSVVNRGFQGAVYFNGPVWIVPAQPGPQQIELPPQVPAPPPPQTVYVQPPLQAPRLYRRPLYLPPLRPYRKPVRPVYNTPRGPVVGVGVRFTTLGITSQEVFGQQLNLMGGGLQLRFRNQGHWGFELGMDALRASIKDGAFVRTSYPFSFSPMLYLRPNRPDNHFNIYAVAGFGLMTDNITLYQDSVQERKQQFWEVLGQVGGGIEVRFTHLALFADIRALGMLLDDSSQAGQYYKNVDGGPIASSSTGYKANLGAIMWF